MSVHLCASPPRHYPKHTAHLLLRCLMPLRNHHHPFNPNHTEQPHRIIHTLLTLLSARSLSWVAGQDIELIVLREFLIFAQEPRWVWVCCVFLCDFNHQLDLLFCTQQFSKYRPVSWWTITFKNENTDFCKNMFI